MAGKQNKGGHVTRGDCDTWSAWGI